MTLTSKFKKDIGTLRAAVNKEIFLDVKNPKLYKKVKRYYNEEVYMDDVNGVLAEDPDREYALIMDYLREDLEGAEV